MPRTISTYALASVTQTRRACGIDETSVLADGSTVLENVLDAIEFASAEVERYLDRQVVTRGALTEYHTPAADPTLLFLAQLPIITITTVVEGYWSDGAYVVSKTLVAGTDYVARTAEGVLVRLSGGSPTSWPTQYEGTRVVYSAGYATTAAVPDHIRRHALSLTARYYLERQNGLTGVQSRTDGLGTVSRFLPAELLKMEQDALASERRYFTTGRAA